MEIKHSIKVAAQKTGLSPHLIRAWEKRYGAIKPARSQTGRRLYSDNDIKRLILLRRATLQGERIGQIANLPDSDLEKLTAGSSGLSIADKIIFSDSADDLDYAKIIDEAIKALKNFDSEKLHYLLMQASIALTQPIMFEKIIIPLLNKIGELWQAGSIKAAHEHIVSTVIRSLLGGMLNSTRPDISSPGLVVTTPAGQAHEFGAIMAALTAIADGWNALYIGPDLPSEDIALAVKQNQAKALALSIVYPPDDPHLIIELGKLRQYLGKSIPILIGGKAAADYIDAIDKISAIYVKDFAGLRTKLGSIRNRRRNEP
jgi:DNA-binding transcriptional MerR regulator